MYALRGVVTDAECPRCGTTSPPPAGKLATCARCGLVFPPHEVQQKVRRTDLPELPEPPPRMIAEYDASTVVVRWPLARYPGVFLASAALFLVWPATGFSAWYLRAPFILAIAVLVYLAAIQLFGTHHVELDSTDVHHRVPFAFLPADRVELATIRRVEVRRDRLGVYEVHLLGRSRRARTRFARGIERAPLAYLATLIGDRLEPPPDPPVRG